MNSRRIAHAKWEPIDTHECWYYCQSSTDPSLCAVAELFRADQPSVSSVLDQLVAACDAHPEKTLAAGTGEYSYLDAVYSVAVRNLPAQLQQQLRARDPQLLDHLESIIRVEGDRQRVETVPNLMLQYGVLKKTSVDDAINSHSQEYRAHAIKSIAWSGSKIEKGLGIQWSVLAELDVTGVLMNPPKIYSGKTVSYCPSVSWGAVLSSIEAGHLSKSYEALSELGPVISAPAGMSKLPDNSQSISLGILADLETQLLGAPGN